MKGGGKYIEHRFRNSTRAFPALNMIIETMWTVELNGQIILLVNMCINTT